jgi:hypothetical protein
VQNSNTQRVIAEAVSEVELWDTGMSCRPRLNDEQLAGPPSTVGIGQTRSLSLVRSVYPGRGAADQDHDAAHST